jgi:hypothetical protein
MIILSIIALYFGAKAASHLAGETRKLNGMYYGLVMFGLSIFASVLIATMIAGNTANAGLLLGMVSAKALWAVYHPAPGQHCRRNRRSAGCPHCDQASCR